jgi:zinc transporter 5/7
MASSYALPVASHSHGRSPSQSSYFTAPSPSRNTRLKPLSPVDEQRHNHAAAHRPHKSDMSAQLSGALRSPYPQPNGSAHDHDHNHDHNHSHDHNHNHDHVHSHGHSRARSNDSTHTTRPFVNGKMNGRPPAEVDLARSSARKHAQSSRYGFISPIQETPHAPPP